MNIIFAGTSDFAVPALQQLLKSKHRVCAVYTQPDRRAGRGQKSSVSPIKALACSVGIRVIQPSTLTSVADIALFASFKADLMIVVAYGVILPQVIIDALPLGCINIHGSLLPRWRGAAPIHRAIMAGDTLTGITIIQIIKKLDAGDILHSELCTIKPQYSSRDLHDKLAILGTVGLQKVLTQFETNTISATKQDESLVTYATKITKNEALINWHLSALTISRQIRGLNSWPVAHSLCQGKVLRIWQASTSYDQSILPAGLVRQQNKRISVGTGKGILDLLEVQLPNKRRISASAFTNAHCIDGVMLK